MLSKSTRCAFNPSPPLPPPPSSSANQPTAHALFSPGELLNVEPLQLFAGLTVEDGLGRLAGDLFEDGALVLGLQVPVDEVLHLGELKLRSRQLA